MSDLAKPNKQQENKQQENEHQEICIPTKDVHSINSSQLESLAKLLEVRAVREVFEKHARLPEDEKLAGVIVRATEESLQNGTAYIGVDNTKAKDVKKAGYRNYGDKGDVGLQITDGKDTLIIRGKPGGKDKSYEIDLPKDVEKTMLKLAGEAEQGNYVARKELGEMVRQVVADVTKGGTSVNR